MQCKEKFDLKDRMPQIIACQKVICLTCLNKCKSKCPPNSGHYRCHFDNIDHPIPPGGYMPADTNKIQLLELNELEEAFNKNNSLLNECEKAYESESARIDQMSNDLKAGIDEKINEISKFIEQTKERLYRQVDNLNKSIKTKLKMCIPKELTEHKIKFGEMLSNLKEILKDIRTNLGKNAQKIEELNTKFEKFKIDSNENITANYNKLNDINYIFQISKYNRKIEFISHNSTQSNDLKELLGCLNIKDSEEANLVELPPGSSEYEIIKGQFMDGNYGLAKRVKNILSIKKVQNSRMFDKYINLKKSFEERDKNNVNEKRLFHGTIDTSVENIWKSGFDPSFAGKIATGIT